MADKITIANAPEKGYVLVYFRTGIVFQAYDGNLEEVLTQYPNDQLLELHAFDEQKEYRVVMGESGMITAGIIRDHDKEETKTETVVLEDRYQSDKRLGGLSQLKIVNYIDYDANGMLFIRNYRIAPGKRGV